MGDEHAQFRSEAFNFQAPVVHQRGRHHQEVRALFLFLSAHVEEAEHLDCLAQAHVVSQAAAEFEAAQGRKPLNAQLLVGAKLGVEARVGFNTCLQLGRAERIQSAREPLAGDDLRPFGPRVFDLFVVTIEWGTGEHAHGLAEADPARLGMPLDIPPLVEHLRELVSVDLDPFAFDQHETMSGCEQLLDLLFRQLLAVQRQTDIEVQQRVHAQGGRRLAADRDRDLGAGLVLGTPPIGHAHNQACLLVQRDLTEEPVCLLGGPGERMVDIAGIYEFADEVALLGRPGQGSQQSEQLLAVLGSDVVLERTPQRQVLWLGQLGDLVDIGGDEGKGILGIALVFGQVEADTAHNVPDRAVLLQVALDTVLVPLGFGR